MLKKNITIKWRNESFTIPVTMDLIADIDEEFNLFKLTMRLSSEKIRFSHAAKLVCTILNIGGSTVTWEEIYTFMYSDGEKSMNATMAMVGEILQALYPDRVDTKKKSVKKTSTKPKSTT